MKSWSRSQNDGLKTASSSRDTNEMRAHVQICANTFPRRRATMQVGTGSQGWGSSRLHRVPSGRHGGRAPSNELVATPRPLRPVKRPVKSCEASTVFNLLGAFAVRHRLGPLQWVGAMEGDSGCPRPCPHQPWTARQARSHATATEPDALACKARARVGDGKLSPPSPRAAQLIQRSQRTSAPPAISRVRSHRTCGQPTSPALGKQRRWKGKTPPGGGATAPIFLALRAAPEEHASAALVSPAL